MIGFNGRGLPQEFKGDFLIACREQKVPHSISPKTYSEAVKQAFPEMSQTHINRLFKNKSIKAFGYVCKPEENPDELFGASVVFAVIKVGKQPMVVFR